MGFVDYGSTGDLPFLPDPDRWLTQGSEEADDEFKGAGSVFDSSFSFFDEPDYDSVYKRWKIDGPGEPYLFYPGSEKVIPITIRTGPFHYNDLCEAGFKILDHWEQGTIGITTFFNEVESKLIRHVWRLAEGVLGENRT